MSNEDRIRNWRARRQQRGYALGEGAVERPGQAEPDAHSPDIHDSSMASPRSALPERDEPMEPRVVTGQAQWQPTAAAALALLLGRLAGASAATVAQRRAVYEALQTEREAEIASAGLAAETADFHRRLLRATIRLVEDDIRAGVDVFLPGYAPATLTVEEARLSSGHGRRAMRRKAHEAREARRLASRQDVALQFELPPQEAADLAVLRARVATLHARQRSYRPGESQGLLATLIPLVILQLHIIHGESRIALLWALLGPAVLLTLISSLYLLSGTHYILAMDVPTFALLGATTWIMFRQIVFRSSTSYVSARSLLNLEAITPLMSALTQALIYLVIYLLVYAVLLSGGYALGLITLPASWSGFLFYVVTIGVGGAAVGILFGSIATAWPFFLRFAPVIERFLQIFSGVFFVSEQLPEQFRPYFLWSPFAHGMQLLRSASFDSYKSHDASLSYFLTSLVFLGVVAVAAERLARSNVQPM
jgi:ABC-type polysaccharide/polyol phosphate export permease